MNKEEQEAYIKRRAQYLKYWQENGPNKQENCTIESCV